MTTPRVSTPVPLTKNDLRVLAWYAAWTPDVHRAAWRARRACPPGFRLMADVSVYSRHAEEYKANMSWPPTLSGDDPLRPSRARASLGELIAYRLIEGTMSGFCRLTARGRAALLLNGLECPSAFTSHCPDVFDDHGLLPVMGQSFRVDMHDTVMGRLPESHRAKHGEPMPDDETTWRIMLEEYADDDYRGRHTFTKAYARLGEVSSNGTALNASMRTHDAFVALSVNDPEMGRVFEMHVSHEQLATLLVSNANVPVTLNHFHGPDGMDYSRPAPPPVSVSRRMKERIARGHQDLQNWIREAIATVRETKMPKGAQASIIESLDLALRDADSHGAFAAEQAAEEVGMVAESMLVVLREQAVLAGVDAAALMGSAGLALPAPDDEA